MAKGLCRCDEVKQGEIILNYPGGPNMITRIPIRRMNSEGQSQREDVRMGAEGREEKGCYVTSFEDGERDLKPKKICGL